MKTLEIHVTCESSQGDIQECTRSIASNSTVDDLSLEDHQNILRAVIAVIIETRAFFQDPEYPDQQRTTLSGLEWHLRGVDAEGEIQTVEEEFYFEKVSEFRELTSLVVDYCKHTDHGAYNQRIWTNEELPAGTYAILPLVFKDRAAIDLYIEFLRTNDLDHEVEQSDAISEIIEHYGWCRETARLAVARVITCCGQHGQEQFSEFVEDGGLSEYLEDRTARAAFLEDIHSEINTWTGREAARSRRPQSRDQYLENLYFWTEPFEEVLTAAELEGIRAVGEEEGGDSLFSRVWRAIWK